jgi:hypothetical protein
LPKQRTQRNGILIGVLPYSIFLAVVLFFVLGGYALFGLVLTLAGRWTAGSLFGLVVAGVIYYATVDIELIPPKQLRLLGILFIIFFFIVGVLTYDSLNNVGLHLIEGVIVTVLYSLFDFLAQKDRSGQSVSKFRETLYYVDIPQFIGLSLIAVYFFGLQGFTANGSPDLQNFLAGAFAFELIAMNAVYTIIQLGPATSHRSAKHTFPASVRIEILEESAGFPSPESTWLEGRIC